MWNCWKPQCLAFFANPSTLDQKYWACGTARCFAGHAAELSGAELIMDERHNWDDLSLPTGTFCRTPYGKQRSISGYAERALGVTSDQAYDLFSEDNTIEDLQRFVKELVRTAEEEI